jgi:hypothetical protein
MRQSYFIGASQTISAVVTSDDENTQVALTCFGKRVRKHNTTTASEPRDIVFNKMKFSRCFITIECELDDISTRPCLPGHTGDQWDVVLMRTSDDYVHIIDGALPAGITLVELCKFVSRELFATMAAIL